MKKIFTLFAVCLFITASAFAQRGYDGHHNDNRGYGNGQYGGYNNDPYRIYNFRTEDELLRDLNLSRSQERKISRINQQFQQAVYRMQYDRFNSAQQKKWQMERLEQQRRQDIMNLLSNFQRDRYNAWCIRNNASSNYGNNNGHYGQGSGRW